MAAEQLHALAARRPSLSNPDWNEYELLGPAARLFGHDSGLDEISLLR
jgi:hypothetical protein